MGKKWTIISLSIININIMRSKKFITLIVLTGAGVIIAWQHIITQFSNFLSYEGTVFKVQNCVIPNPVTTPCFYGGFGFIVALIIAILFFKKNPTKKALMWFTIYLLAGSIFAWTFAGRDLINFFGGSTGAGTVGCSGLIINNPFTTACFMGASLFLLSFIVSLIILLRSPKTTAPTI